MQEKERKYFLTKILQIQTHGIQISKTDCWVMDQPLKGSIGLQPKSEISKSKTKKFQAPGLQDERIRDQRLEFETYRFKTSGLEALIFEILKFGIENSKSNIISNDN